MLVVAALCAVIDLAPEKEIDADLVHLRIVVIAVADHALLRLLPVPMTGGGDPPDRDLLLDLAPDLILDPDPAGLPDRRHRLALHPLLHAPLHRLRHLARVYLVAEAEIVVAHEGNSLLFRPLNWDLEGWKGLTLVEDELFSASCS